MLHHHARIHEGFFSHKTMFFINVLSASTYTTKVSKLVLLSYEHVVLLPTQILDQGVA